SLGEIRVVGPLDSQQHKSYRLTVRLTDTHNDLDLAKSRSRLCDVAVRLQPLVVTRTEAVWHPPAWFVAVLTVSGILLLATLGLAKPPRGDEWLDPCIHCCSDHAREKTQARPL
uniref:Uncharacterized protein n=1 Tax=Strix occidentalis caurina TaxID=311401 RepID=A0A8D0FLA7_STROC